MDIDMPRMNGFQATKEINTILRVSNRKENNICIHSAYLKGDSDEIVKEIGVKHKVAKPFSMK